MRLIAPCSLFAFGILASAASAELTSFRDWIDTHGLSSNGPGQTWCGLSGLNGGLLETDGSSWRSDGQQYDWPMIGPIVNPGDYNGSAGAATFAGLWGRPGIQRSAVLEFTPQSSMMATGFNVQSELIANGLLGDGVLFTIVARIGGHTSTLGSFVLAGTTDARLDFFSFGGLTELNAGDSVSVVISNNGSFLYDHVNFNAWIIPGPGGMAFLMAGGLVRGRRRR